MAATEPYTKGLEVLVLMDHRNNLFTSSLLGNRRVNKKLLRWSLDLEEYGTRLVRQWIRGADNILADSPSRNPKDRDAARALVVPGGLIKNIIEKMFRAPHALEEGNQELHEMVGSIAEGDVDTGQALRRLPPES